MYIHCLPKHNAYVLLSTLVMQCGGVQLQLICLSHNIQVIPVKYHSTRNCMKTAQIECWSNRKISHMMKQILSKTMENHVLPWAYVIVIAFKIMPCVTQCASKFPLHLKCHYDEGCIFSIEVNLKHKQVACMSCSLFTMFRYVFFFQIFTFLKYAN